MAQFSMEIMRLTGSVLRGNQHTWADKSGKTLSYRVPANLRPYVDALGLDLACTFFLSFGGAPVYLAENPTESSAVSAVIGKENVIRLAKAMGGAGHLSRVPVDKRFLARYMAGNGWTVLAIARRLLTSDVTIRSYLADPATANGKRVASMKSLKHFADTRILDLERSAETTAPQPKKRLIGLRSGV